jgi:hypothetical protein
MDVHKPKPVHGWRDFATEIVTIVIGVVIALGGEQIVEQIHWRGQLAQARAEMRDELHSSAYAAYERLVVAPCLSARLTKLRGELLSASAEWPGDMLVQGHASDGGIPPAYIAPWRQWTSQAYDALLASGAAGHMTAKEMLAYSRVYSIVREMRMTGDAEQSSVGRLADLSTKMTLPEGAKEDFLEALADARQDNRRARTLAEEMLAPMADLGLALPTSERQGLITQMQAIFGACATAQTVPLPT